MALVIKDRVKETTTTTGTGTYTLGGAVTGFETFTANLSNADTTFYGCTDGSDFEVGVGTFTSSGTTAEITAKDDSSNILTVFVPTSSFTVSETVTGGTTSASTTISSIGSDGTETWLSKNAVNGLLYGSLLEAYIYMKGESDVIKMYSDRFMEELSRLKDLGEARENSDSYRTGLKTQPKT